MKFYLPLILCLITSWLDGPPILYLFYMILFWVLGKFDNEEKNKKVKHKEVKEKESLRRCPNCNKEVSKTREKCLWCNHTL
jgi:hypothetical protein